MDLRRLEDWVTYCDNLTSTAALDGGGWVVSMSTPPPVLADPMARIPLERAGELRERMGATSDAEEREQLRAEALEWLNHPHPNTTAEIQSLIESAKAELAT